MKTGIAQDSDIQIRQASIKDIHFIISLIPRLTEFGPPSWRNQNEMLNIDEQVLRDNLEGTPDNSIIFFIAEDLEKTPLGFIHLHEGTDYYYKEKHGHIADLIVAKEGEGRGIGRLLIKKAEEWAHSKGYRWLTLSVFAQNVRARDVYNRLGFNEDVMKYVKVIG
jgi:GNAT superfamily N-acetyltransferase